MSNDFSSLYIVAPLVGWFMAHLAKFILTIIVSGGKEKDIKIFFRPGGMPSSHTAVMAATLGVIAGTEGIGSPIFGLALAVTAIVMYDALNVRRSVGELGDVLRKVTAHTKIDDRFRIAYGHTGPEVVAGALLGLLCAWALLQIL